MIWKYTKLSMFLLKNCSQQWSFALINWFVRMLIHTWQSPMFRVASLSRATLPACERWCQRVDWILFFWVRLSRFWNFEHFRCEITAGGIATVGRMIETATKATWMTSHNSGFECSFEFLLFSRMLIQLLDILLAQTCWSSFLATGMMLFNSCWFMTLCRFGTAVVVLFVVIANDDTFSCGSVPKKQL